MNASTKGPVSSIDVCVVKEGILTPTQLKQAHEQLSYLRSTKDKVVSILYGRDWSKSYPKTTFNDAWDKITAANAPRYTENILTSSWNGVKFFHHPNDIMISTIYNVDHSILSKYNNLTEDVLIGSKDSFSTVHVDNAPCVGSRITVIVGCKTIAAWPFDPKVDLPNWVPVYTPKTPMETPDFTENAWKEILKYATKNKGWVKTLKPGKVLFCES